MVQHPAQTGVNPPWPKTQLDNAAKYATEKENYKLLVSLCTVCMFPFVYEFQCAQKKAKR